MVSGVLDPNRGDNEVIALQGEREEGAGHEQRTAWRHRWSRFLERLGRSLLAPMVEVPRASREILRYREIPRGGATPS